MQCLHLIKRSSHLHAKIIMTYGTCFNKIILIFYKNLITITIIDLAHQRNHIKKRSTKFKIPSFALRLSCGDCHVIVVIIMMNCVVGTT